MFLKQQNITISEGSCDTEDWSNDTGSSSLITTIDYLLQYFRIENSNFKCIIQLKKMYTASLKPRSHYKRHSVTKQHDPIHFNGGLAVSGDTSHSDHWRPNGGVSSDVTKFRILQLYANEEQFAGATANRIEDG